MRRILTLLTLAFFCTLSFAQEKRKELPKVAVYIMDNPQDSTFLKDAVSHALNTSKKYSVVALDARAAISAEQKRQHSGEVKEADIAKLGEASGADFVCTVRRPRGNLVRVSFVGVQSLSEVSGRSWMLNLPLDTDEYEGTKYVETEIHETLGVLAESKLAEAQKETLEVELRKAEQRKAEAERESSEIERQRKTLEAEKQRIALETETQRIGLEAEMQRVALEKEKQKQYEKAGLILSTSDRWKTFGLNFIPGLGSVLIMDDWTGAIVAWSVAGAGYLVGTLATSEYDNSDDELDVPISEYITNSLIIASLFNLPWNIYRSITYDKPLEKTSLIDPRNFNLFAMPSANPKRKSLMPGVFYNVRF